MKDPATGKLVYGRTRWRRFGILLVPSFGIVALLTFLVATGVLAVSFSVSGIPFKLSADRLDGTGFVQLGSMNKVAACDASNATSCATVPPGGPAGSAGDYQFTAATLLDTATITNLDQTVCSAIPGFTPLIGALTGTPLYGLVELKGGDSTPAHAGVAAFQPHATTLIVDATALKGDLATFANGINIGQNYHVTGASPFGETPTDTFAQTAPTVEIDGLHQTGTDTYAGSFVIPNLNLTASLVSTCP